MQEVRRIKDLSIRELVNLTEEERQNYVLLEAAEEGVPPIVPKVPDMPKLFEFKNAATYYAPKAGSNFLPVAFTTRTAAEEFMRREDVVYVADEWTGGKGYHSTSVAKRLVASGEEEGRQEQGWEIQERRLPTFPQFLAEKARITEVADLRSVVQKAEQEAEKVARGMGAARSTVATTIEEAHEQWEAANRIKECADSYLKLSNNNAVVATRFLFKAFPLDRIASAATILGQDFPSWAIPPQENIPDNATDREE